MPYVKHEDRRALRQTRSAYPGQLNYTLSQVVDKYLSDRGGPSYTNYNDVIGVLECMKMELYRRFIGPYEDEKLAENGEVYFHDPKRVKLPRVVKAEVPLSRRYTDPSELEHV